MSHFFVYALVNPDSKIYIGQTEDLQRRIEQHNDPEYRYTLHTKRVSGPWTLFYQETIPSRKEARLREKQLKTSRGRDFLREILKQKSLPDLKPSI